MSKSSEKPINPQKGNEKEDQSEFLAPMYQDPEWQTWAAEHMRKQKEWREKQEGKRGER